METQQTSEDRIVTAPAEELAAWDKYKTESKITTIPVPYAFVAGGVNVAGVVFVENPVENSSTKGTAVGAIIGTYTLNRQHTTVNLYDPTGNLLRLGLAMDVQHGTLKARICNRKWNGDWNCSGWSVIASW